MDQEIVKAYYDTNAESELSRLATPYNQVEYHTTLHLIEKYFNKRGRVLDVGCGPGRYSLALLEKGYTVSLLDLSQKELDIAKKRISEKGYEAEGYYCQSAMALEGFKDESFDYVLLMGPMYHLHGEENRLHVLKEVRRILKPGGKALVAYINMWGVLKASLYECPQSFESEQQLYQGEPMAVELQEGQSFTEVYFTTPPIALKEIEQSGFKMVSYAGAESFLSGMFIELKNLAHYMPDTYRGYMKKACEFCELPQYRDATEHVHIIVEK